MVFGHTDNEAWYYDIIDIIIPNVNIYDDYHFVYNYFVFDFKLYFLLLLLTLIMTPYFPYKDLFLIIYLC